MSITFHNKQVRPMRAYKLKDTDLPKIIFPLWGSPKFDGWRCIVHEGVGYTNTLIPVPNQYVQQVIKENQLLLNGKDGELVLNWTKEYNEVQSAMSSFSGFPEFEFQIFDDWRSALPFEDRMDYVTFDTAAISNRHIKRVEHKLIYTVEELLEYDDECLARGFEGSCYRRASALYKFGKGTFSDGCLYKRKPFVDDEAIIIGFYEQLENTNEAELDNRGLSKRSSHQDNKLSKNTLGGFICSHQTFGEIRIGTGEGLTKLLRKQIWDNQKEYLYRPITFKYQQYGTLNKPRIGIFLRFRNALDMSL